MSQPRTLSRSLAALGLLGALGLGSMSFLGEEADPASGDQKERPTGVAARFLPPGPQTDQIVYFDSAPAPAPGRLAAPAATLGAQEAASLAEQAALRLLARDSDLELTARQWTAFAAATAHIQTIRQAFEASLATVKQMPDGRCRMEIPAYATAGDALRGKLTAELIKQLGEETATEILATLGGKLEGYFGGFGVSVQTLDFAVSAGTAADFQVTRTVQYWNAVEGGSELRTRRETHFPGLEDPSGDVWQPFLARLAEGQRGTQRSG